MNLEQHPCFNSSARHTYGRVHLPVAPRCNIQCNYCNRDFDCAHESRPGVTSRIMKAEDTPSYVEALRERCPTLAVVGIAGPGDPFASPEETLKSLSLVHSAFSDLLLCVATNGLNLAPYIGELANLGVSHVTITINTVDPSVGQYLYAWVRAGKRNLAGYEGAAYLLDQQLAGIRSLKDAGIVVKVNTVFVPGVNDRQVVTLAQYLATLGADIMNIIPLYPVKGTPFAHKPTPSSEELLDARKRASQYLPQMTHCARCRADAAGLIGKDIPLESIINHDHPDPGIGRVAIASYEGMLINQHLGEARELQIYEIKGSHWVFVETRPLPAPGGGDKRWLTVAEFIKDCGELWVSGIGDNPRRILKDSGCTVRVLQGLIDQVLDRYCKGEALEQWEVHRPHRCGEICSGTGLGCG